jgi:uncharacterized protein YdaU (DUF1376 family)
VSPWTLLTTHALSKISSVSFYEWPTAIATAAVVGLNSIKKIDTAVSKRDFSSYLVHLFNAIGTFHLTFDTLGIYPLLNRDSWEKMKSSPNENDKNELEETLRKIRAETAEKIKQSAQSTDEINLSNNKKLEKTRCDLKNIEVENQSYIKKARADLEKVIFLRRLKPI